MAAEVKLSPNLLGDMEKASKEIIKKILLAAELKAKEKVPVRTGALRDSISVDEETLTLGASAVYAAAVEYGTAKQPAQPYLTPANGSDKRSWGVR